MGKAREMCILSQVRLEPENCLGGGRSGPHTILPRTPPTHASPTLAAGCGCDHKAYEGFCALHGTEYTGHEIPVVFVGSRIMQGDIIVAVI